MRIKFQQILNAKVHVVLFNFYIGDYVTMHPTNERYGQLTTGCIGPVSTVDTKADLVFKVQDLHKIKSFTAHPQ